MFVDEILVTFPKGATTTKASLLPFGDLQVGSPLFSRRTWDEYVEALGRAVNPMTIGMGDYTDHFRPTVQARLATAAAGDREQAQTMEELHKGFMDREIVPLLRPVIERSACLGLLAGHHDMGYTDGTNSTQYLCKALKVPYLGRGEAMLRVNLKWGTLTRCLSFTLWASHGEGGATTALTARKKLKDMMTHVQADVFLRAHSCDKFIFQEPLYFLSRSNPPRLRQGNRIIANTGGFSDSRVEGVDTYVERSNLMPKAMGWVEIHINVKRDCGPVVSPSAHGRQQAAYLVMGD